MGLFNLFISPLAFRGILSTLRPGDKFLCRLQHHSFKLHHNPSASVDNSKHSDTIKLLTIMRKFQSEVVRNSKHFFEQPRAPAGTKGCRKLSPSLPFTPHPFLFLCLHSLVYHLLSALFLRRVTNAQCLKDTRTSKPANKAIRLSEGGIDT